MDFSKLLSKKAGLCILGLSLTACGGAGRKQTNVQPPSNPEQKYFLLGDVSALWADTQLDQNTPFAKANLSNFEDFALSGVLVFQQRLPESEVEQISGQQDLESRNQTDNSEEKDFSPTTSYAFSASSASSYEYRSLFGYDLRFEFDVNSNEQLVLTSFNLGGRDSTRVDKMLHYSMSPDESMFSFLFTYLDPVYGESLVAAYFTKNSDRIEDSLYFKTDESYSYLLGDDVAIGWQDQLNLEICGPLALDYRDIAEEAVSQWWSLRDESGSLGYLELGLEVNENPPPFSDVNHTCLYFAEGYSFSRVKNASTLGIAFPVFNYSKARLVAASSFISLDAHKGRLEGRLASTTAHELGHVIGLGHEFKRDEFGESLYDSIMGYSGVSFVTDRDEEAIRALYPQEDPKLSISFR